jgi:hypothetical protein
MRLLLVTGAGASRDLGLEKPLPLLSDWAASLCAALDEREASLAHACLLRPDMNGPEFETNLGLLLTWEKFRHLEERFAYLGGSSAGSYQSEVVRIRERVGRRMAIVMETINKTLFTDFGRRQIDDAKAKSAFGNLLRTVDAQELIVATTNYDGAGEAGLSALGFDVDRGFRGLAGQTPALRPTGMVEYRGRRVPFIHLHGAVGWYEHEGTVRDHNSDLEYIPSLGTPVVLYPDPDKDPTRDALVSSLWMEFEAALSVVDAVLVVGHSLHDPALHRTLEATARSKPVAITYATALDRNEMQARFRGGAFVPMVFGPEIETDIRGLRQALESDAAPA